MKRPDGIYKAILTEEQLKYESDFILKSINYLGVDTETTSVNYLTCNLLGISLAYEHNNLYYGFYIPVKYNNNEVGLWDNSNKYLDIPLIREYLNPIFENEKICKILHNVKFDMHVLNRHGFPLNGTFDTMIGAWVLGNASTARYGLKHLAKKKLGYDMLSFKEVTGKDKDFSKTPLNVAVDYAAPDGDMTLRLYRKEMDVLRRYDGLLPTLDLELKAIPVLKDMESIGAKIDRKFLKKSGTLLNKEMKYHLNSALELFKKDFNLNSEEQLIEVLKDQVDPYIQNVQAKTLESFIDKHPAINHILEYRKRLKLKSVYIDGILSKLDNNDRIHTEFYQMLKTGRLSSKNPNLQNIPTKKDESYSLPLIRKAFIADPGYKFVCIDYSQLELRVITHVSEEKYWIDAFKNGKDIHTATAAAVYHKSIDDVTKYERKRAKFVNFGLLYGESAYGLSKREGITVDEAQQFINDYFAVLPNIQEYINSRKRQVVTKGYTETFNGRRLYFDYDKYDNRSVMAAQREGINFPIQGGASDIVKTAMYEVHKLLIPYKSKLTLQVHDELDFEMAEDEMPILIPQIVSIMSNVFKLKVDLNVDVEYGNNWEDLTNWIQ